MSPFKGGIVMVKKMEKWDENIAYRPGVDFNGFMMDDGHMRLWYDAI